MEKNRDWVNLVLLAFSENSPLRFPCLCELPELLRSTANYLWIGVVAIPGAGCDEAIR